MAATWKMIEFGGLSNNLAESAESEKNAWASLNCWHDNGILEGMRRYKVIGRRSSFASTDVGYGLGYGKVSSNEIQKWVMSGGPTGGTFTATFSGQTTATIPYNCTAAQVQSKLEALSNIEVGDVIVTGGPFPGLPIFVEWVGQFARTNVALMTDDSSSLSGGSLPDVAITEKVRGGNHEGYFAVVQPSGSGDSTLYLITSSDEFATTTWTSIATDFDSTHWFFEQYADKMCMVNSTDGLRYMYIGTPSLGSTPPAAPGTAPTVEEAVTSLANTAMWTTAATVAVTGPGTAATVTKPSDGLIKVVFNATETNIDIVVTATLSADKDWSFGRDVGRFVLSIAGGPSGATGVNMEDATIEIVNADGSPVTIIPDYLSKVVYTDPATVAVKWFHFADEARTSRDNIHQVILRFPNSFMESGDTCYIGANLGDTWPNDTRALKIDPPQGQTVPDAINSGIYYAYTYYDTSEATESRLSPITGSQSIPSNDGRGCRVTLTGIGSTALNTTDDRVLFYRQEKGTGKWRRLPNIAGYTQLSHFGATNATASSPSMTDGWMEHEISAFPEFDGIGFPPINTGASADCIGVWKGTLDIGSGPLCFESWVNLPFKFEPAPGTTGFISPDPDDFPDVGVTEYVPDNRGENIMALKGQDSLYGMTNLSSYAKVGNTPATASRFRRLPGSRGCVGRRASTRYGGGVLNAAQDGLWFYDVTSGFRGENTGSLYEREETGGNLQVGAPGVRRSYQRLLSEMQSLTFSGTYTSGDTFTITIAGNTTVPIPCTAKAYDVRLALEDMTNVNFGDIEVFGDDLVNSAGEMTSGKMFFRFLQQFAQTNMATITVTPSTSLITATVATESTGGTSDSTIIVEHNDEYHMFNDHNYLSQSRNRKWVEGVLADKIVAAHADRNRGLVCLTGDGKLIKFTEGQTTDVDTEVTWRYETPWMTGDRARVIGVGAIVKGSVSLRIMADDGAGSVTVYGLPSPHTTDLTLDESKYMPLNGVCMPGVRHKLILSGRTGFDAVFRLGLKLQPEGDPTGS